MRKIEMITMFNANCLVIPNNSLSLTHSLYTLNIRMERRPMVGRRDKRHIRLCLRRGRKAFCVHTLTKESKSNNKQQ